VSESVNPGRPELEHLSIEQTGKRVVSALGKVTISLVLGILQEILVVIDESRSEKL
jgi:hypothetical protein